MKKGKKILSLGLAAAMAVSVGTAAFAASADETTYQAEYTKNNPKESITTVIDQLDTVVNDALVTGDTLEALYGFLPSLSILVTGADDASFYKNLEPEIFAELPDGAVTADTLTAYFAEHPIVIENSDDFMTKADTWVEAVVCQNIGNTVVFLLFMSPPETLAGFANGIDKLCSALGIAQEKSFYDVTGWNLAVSGGMADVAGMQTYVKNILHAFMPDTVSQVLSALQVALVGQGAVDLHTALTDIVDNLAGIVLGLEGTLSTFGLDITEIVNIINQIQSIVNGLPTKEIEEGTAFDAEATISALPAMLSDILPMFGVELPLDLSGVLAISFDEPPTGFQIVKLTLESFNDANIEAAADNEDFLMVVANYIYRNFVANDSNNAALMTVLSIAESLLPAEVTDLLYALLAVPSFDEFVWALRDQVSILSGNDTIGAYPVDEPTTDEPTTDEPTTDEPTTDEPTTDEPTTDEPTTDEPTTDEPTTDEPTTDEPTTDEPTTDEPTTGEPTTAAPSTTAPAGTGSSTNNDTPDTGDAVLGVVAFAGVAAAASVVLLRKKK